MMESRCNTNNVRRQPAIVRQPIAQKAYCGIRHTLLSIAQEAKTPENAIRLSNRLHSYIAQMTSSVKWTERFLKLAYRKILFVHFFCCKVAQESQQYVVDQSMKDALVAYIELEINILMKPQYKWNESYQALLKKRVTRLLWTIYSKYIFYSKGKLDRIHTWEVILKFLQSELPLDVPDCFKNIISNIKKSLPPKPKHPHLPYYTVTCKQDKSSKAKANSIDLTKDSSQTTHQKEDGGLDEKMLDYMKILQKRNARPVQHSICRPTRRSINRKKLRENTKIVISDDSDEDEVQSSSSSPRGEIEIYRQPEELIDLTEEEEPMNLGSIITPDPIAIGEVEQLGEVLIGARTLLSKIQELTGSSEFTIRSKNGNIQIERLKDDADKTTPSAKNLDKTLLTDNDGVICVSDSDNIATKPCEKTVPRDSVEDKPLESESIPNVEQSQDESIVVQTKDTTVTDKDFLQIVPYVQDQKSVDGSLSDKPTIQQIPDPFPSVVDSAINQIDEDALLDETDDVQSVNCDDIDEEALLRDTGDVPMSITDNVDVSSLSEPVCSSTPKKAIVIDRSEIEVPAESSATLEPTDTSTENTLTTPNSGKVLNYIEGYKMCTKSQYLALVNVAPKGDPKDVIETLRTREASAQTTIPLDTLVEEVQSKKGSIKEIVFDFRGGYPRVGGVNENITGLHIKAGTSQCDISSTDTNTSSNTRPIVEPASVPTTFLKDSQYEKDDTLAQVESVSPDEQTKNTDLTPKKTDSSDGEDNLKIDESEQIPEQRPQKKKDVKRKVKNTFTTKTLKKSRKLSKSKKAAESKEVAVDDSDDDDDDDVPLALKLKWPFSSGTKKRKTSSTKSEPVVVQDVSEKNTFPGSTDQKEKVGRRTSLKSAAKRRLSKDKKEVESAKEEKIYTSKLRSRSQSTSQAPQDDEPPPPQRKRGRPRREKSKSTIPTTSNDDSILKETVPVPCAADNFFPDMRSPKKSPTAPIPSLPTRTLKPLKKRYRPLHTHLPLLGKKLEQLLESESMDLSVKEQPETFLFTSTVITTGNLGFLSGKTDESVLGTQESDNIPTSSKDYKKGDRSDNVVDSAASDKEQRSNDLFRATKTEGPQTSNKSKPSETKLQDLKERRKEFITSMIGQSSADGEKTKAKPINLSIPACRVSGLEESIQSEMRKASEELSSDKQGVSSEEGQTKNHSLEKMSLVEQPVSVHNASKPLINSEPINVNEIPHEASSQNKQTEEASLHIVSTADSPDEASSKNVKSYDNADSTKVDIDPETITSTNVDTEAISDNVVSTNVKSSHEVTVSTSVESSAEANSKLNDASYIVNADEVSPKNNCSIEETSTSVESSDEAFPTKTSFENVDVERPEKESSDHVLPTSPDETCSENVKCPVDISYDSVSSTTEEAKSETTSSTNIVNRHVKIPDTAISQSESDVSTNTANVNTPDESPENTAVKSSADDAGSTNIVKSPDVADTSTIEKDITLGIDLEQAVNISKNITIENNPVTVKVPTKASQKCYEEIITQPIVSHHKSAPRKSSNNLLKKEDAILDNETTTSSLELEASCVKEESTQNEKKNVKSQKTESKPKVTHKKGKKELEKLVKVESHSLPETVPLEETHEKFEKATETTSGVESSQLLVSEVAEAKVNDTSSSKQDESIADSTENMQNDNCPLVEQHKVLEEKDVRGSTDNTSPKEPSQKKIIEKIDDIDKVKDVVSPNSTKESSTEDKKDVQHVEKLQKHKPKSIEKVLLKLDDMKKTKKDDQASNSKVDEEIKRDLNESISNRIKLKNVVIQEITDSEISKEHPKDLSSTEKHCLEDDVKKNEQGINNDKSDESTTKISVQIEKSPSKSDIDTKKEGDSTKVENIELSSASIQSTQKEEKNIPKSKTLKESEKKDTVSSEQLVDNSEATTSEDMKTSTKPCGKESTKSIDKILVPKCDVLSQSERSKLDKADELSNVPNKGEVKTEIESPTLPKHEAKAKKITKTEEEASTKSEKSKNKIQKERKRSSRNSSKEKKSTKKTDAIDEKQKSVPKEKDSAIKDVKNKSGEKSSKDETIYEVTRVRTADTSLSTEVSTKNTDKGNEKTSLENSLSTDKVCSTSTKDKGKTSKVDEGKKLKKEKETTSPEDKSSDINLEKMKSSEALKRETKSDKDNKKDKKSAVSKSKSRSHKSRGSSSESSKSNDISTRDKRSADRESPRPKTENRGSSSESTKSLDKSKRHKKSDDRESPKRENRSSRSESTKSLDVSKRDKKSVDRESPRTESRGSSSESTKSLDVSKRHKKSVDRESPKTESRGSSSESTKSLDALKSDKKSVDRESPKRENRSSRSESTKSLDVSKRHKKSVDRESPKTESRGSSSESTKSLDTLKSDKKSVDRESPKRENRSSRSESTKSLDVSKRHKKSADRESARPKTENRGSSSESTKSLYVSKRDKKSVDRESPKTRSSSSESTKSLDVSKRDKKSVDCEIDSKKERNSTEKSSSTTINKDDKSKNSSDDNKNKKSSRKSSRSKNKDRKSRGSSSDSTKSFDVSGRSRKSPDRKRDTKDEKKSEDTIKISDSVHITQTSPANNLDKNKTCELAKKDIIKDTDIKSSRSGEMPAGKTQDCENENKNLVEKKDSKLKSDKDGATALLKEGVDKINNDQVNREKDSGTTKKKSKGESSLDINTREVDKAKRFGDDIPLPDSKRPRRNSARLNPIVKEDILEESPSETIKEQSKSTAKKRKRNKDSTSKKADIQATDNSPKNQNVGSANLSNIDIDNKTKEKEQIKKEVDHEKEEQILPIVPKVVKEETVFKTLRTELSSKNSKEVFTKKNEKPIDTKEPTVDTQTVRKSSRKRVTKTEIITNKSGEDSIAVEKLNQDENKVEPIPVDKQENLNQDNAEANKETEVTIQCDDRELYIMLDNDSVNHKKKRKSSNIDMDGSANISECKKMDIKIDGDSKRKNQSEISDHSERVRLDLLLVQEQSSIEMIKDTQKPICREPEIINAQELEVVPVKKITTEPKVSDVIDNVSVLNTDTSKTKTGKVITVEANPICHEPEITITQEMKVVPDKEITSEPKVSDVIDNVSVLNTDKSKTKRGKEIIIEANPICHEPEITITQEMKVVPDKEITSEPKVSDVIDNVSVLNTDKSKTKRGKEIIIEANPICDEPEITITQEMKVVPDKEITTEPKVSDVIDNVSVLNNDSSKTERGKEITVEAFESFVTSTKVDIGLASTAVLEVENNVGDKTKNLSNVSANKKRTLSRSSTDSNVLPESTQVCSGDVSNKNLAIDDVIEEIIQSSTEKRILEQKLDITKVMNHETKPATDTPSCNQEVKTNKRKRSSKHTLVEKAHANVPAMDLELREIPPASTSTHKFGEAQKMELPVVGESQVKFSVLSSVKQTVSDSAEQMDLQKKFEREFMNEINNFQNRANQKGDENGKIHSDKGIHNQDLTNASLTFIESSNSNSSISTQPVSEHHNLDSIIGSVLDYDYEFFGNTETVETSHVNNASIIDFDFNTVVTSNNTAFHNHDVQYTSINAFDTSTYTPIYPRNSGNCLTVTSVSPKVTQQSTYQTIPVTINQEFGSAFERSILRDAQKCSDHSYADDIIGGKSRVSPASTVEAPLHYIPDSNNAVFTTAPGNLQFNPIFSDTSRECTLPPPVSLETNDIFQVKTEPLSCSGSNIMDSMISGGQITDVGENLVIRSSDCNNTDTMDTSNPLASSGVLDEALDFCLESIIDEPTRGVPVSHLRDNFTINGEIHGVCIERSGSDQEMPDFFEITAAHEIPEPVSEISIVTQNFIDEEEELPVTVSNFESVSPINTDAGLRTLTKNHPIPIHQQVVEVEPKGMEPNFKPGSAIGAVKRLRTPTRNDHITKSPKLVEESGSVHGHTAIIESGTRKLDELKLPCTKTKSPSAPTRAATRAKMSSDEPSFPSSLDANKKKPFAGSSHNDVTLVRSSTKIRTSPRKPPTAPPPKVAKTSTIKPEKPSARRKTEDNYDLISTLTKPNTKQTSESESTTKTTRAHPQSHANISVPTDSSDNNRSEMDLLFDKVVNYPVNKLFQQSVKKQKEGNKPKVVIAANVKNIQNSRKQVPTPQIVKSSTVKPGTPRTRRTTEENYDLISTLTKSSNQPKSESEATARSTPVHTKTQVNTSLSGDSSEKTQITKQKKSNTRNVGSKANVDKSQNSSKYPLFPDPPANFKTLRSRKTDPYTPEKATVPTTLIVKSITIKPGTPRTRRKTEETFDLISTLTKPNNLPKSGSEATARTTSVHTKTQANTSSSDTSIDQLKNELTKLLSQTEVTKQKESNKRNVGSKANVHKFQNSSDSHDMSLSRQSSSQNTNESVKSKSEPYHQSSKSPATKFPLFPDPPAIAKTQKSRKTDPYTPEDDDQFSWNKDFLHDLRKFFDRDESSLQLPGTRSATSEPSFEEV